LFGEKVHGQYNQNVFDGRTLTPILFEELPMPERTLFWRKGKEWAIRRETLETDWR
jgi:hypothetical protein